MKKISIQDQIIELRNQVNGLTDAVEAISSPKHGNKTILGENVFVDPTTVLISGENATIRLGDHTKVWRGGE